MSGGQEGNSINCVDILEATEELVYHKHPFIDSHDTYITPKAVDAPWVVKECFIPLISAFKFKINFLSLDSPISIWGSGFLSALSTRSCPLLLHH